MHVSMFMVAPGPPATALDDAGDRMDILWERGWGDYFQLGGEHLHSWRVPHADPDDPANIPGIEWCDRIALPLDRPLLTIAYVSPAARVFWAPVEQEASPEWPAWVNRMTNLVRRGARDGSCVVIADFHC